MARLGFTNYDDPTPPEPTVPEILAAMSVDQKVAVLDGFAEKVLPQNWRQWMKEFYPEVDNRVPRKVIRTLYHEIDAIEEWCRTEMRGERVVTPAIPPDPAVPDDEGTPAVYNTPPATVTALREAAGAAFQDIFTVAQVAAVVNKMIACSVSDGSGTWAYYKAEVVK